jgi:hypothetical protein
MKYRTAKKWMFEPQRRAWCLAFALGIAAGPVHAAAQSRRAGRAPTRPAATRPAATKPAAARPTEASQPLSVAAPNSGIVSLQVSPDTIATIRTAQGVITRIALPDEATEAICGDLFDPATSQGSFVITKSGTDVFIKPLVAKAQSNLFIKTGKPESKDTPTVFNFDVVVVPSAQAYRVVNVNLPSYAVQVEALKEEARRSVEAERQKMQEELKQQYDARLKEFETQSAGTLEGERKKLSAEADRRAAELAMRRLVDGILQGFNGVPIFERRGRSEQMVVELDAVAYTFEGKLYVRYTIDNEGSGELTYREPKLAIRTVQDRERAVPASVYTSRGEYSVPAGEQTQGVIVFERPRMQRGERLYLTIRVDNERYVQLRLVEQDVR